MPLTSVDCLCQVKIKIDSKDNVGSVLVGGTQPGEPCIYCNQMASASPEGK